MKTITMNELRMTKELVKDLTMAKAAIAITNYNVETNAINKRMFLYSDENIILYTNGKLYFGTAKKQNLKFTFDPAQSLPYVVNCFNRTTRVNVKNMIEDVLSTKQDAIKLNDGFIKLIANYENVLACFVKEELINGNRLPASTQVKYDWCKDPSAIKLVRVDKEVEVAATENKEDVVIVTVKIEKKDIMKLAHKLRREMEAEDKDFAICTYRSRMTLALNYAWDIYRTQRDIAPIHSDLTVKTNTAKDEVIAPVVVETERQLEVAGTDNKVIELTSKKKEKLQEEIMVDIDDKAKPNRVEGQIYISTEPGFVYAENHLGQRKLIADISKDKKGRGTFADINVRFTEKEFAKSKFYNANAATLIIITDNKEYYEEYKDAKGFIATDK